MPGSLQAREASLDLALGAAARLSSRHGLAVGIIQPAWRPNGVVGMVTDKAKEFSNFVPDFTSKISQV